jgi:uncharacterized protein involved in outer membrane biogenesis
MKRIIKWSALGLSLLIVIAVVVVYFNLSRIVERTIEVQATDSLSLQTELSGVGLSLFGGQLSLKELTIASPQGFAAPHMLTLAGGDISVSYGQLRSDPVRIKSITLTGPLVVVEQSGGKFNFQTLMDLPSRRSPGNPKDGQRQDGEPLRVIIDRLVVEGAQVIIKPGTIPGLDAQLQQVTVPIPTLELTNIGNADGAQNGAALKDVASTLIQELVSRAGDSAALQQQLKDALNKGLSDIKSRAAQEIQKKTQDLEKKLGPLGSGLGDKLKNATDSALDKPGDNPTQDDKDRPRRRPR